MSACSAFPHDHEEPEPLVSIQPLVLLLDAITAGDYLTRLRDPEPTALGRELRSLAVHASPLCDRIHVVLGWNGEPPEPRIAAAAAGFALTPEVCAVLIPPAQAPATPPTGDPTGDLADVNRPYGGDLGVHRTNHVQRRKHP